MAGKEEAAKEKCHSRRFERGLCIGFRARGVLCLQLFEDKIICMSMYCHIQSNIKLMGGSAYLRDIMDINVSTAKLLGSDATYVRDSVC